MIDEGCVEHASDDDEVDTIADQDLASSRQMRKRVLDEEFKEDHCSLEEVEFDDMVLDDLEPEIYEEESAEGSKRK